jgi:hypothetical protein
MVGAIELRGGSYAAMAQAQGAAIGSGYACEGNSTVGIINITGGNWTAAGGCFAAAIGSGIGEYGNSTVELLLISGGTITATGLHGVGIGSGSTLARNLTVAGMGITNDEITTAGVSAVRNITVFGGDINATGYKIAFGDGESSLVHSIEIFNGLLALATLETGSGLYSEGPVMIRDGLFDCSAIGSGLCFNTSSLKFETGSTIAITSAEVVGASSECQVSGIPELYFEYLSNSRPESFKSLPSIHLESISLPDETLYKLKIARVDGPAVGIVREVQFDGRRSRGCAFSLPDLGTYTISFESMLSEAEGWLGHDGTPVFIVNTSADNFFAHAELVASPLPSRTPALTATPGTASGRTDAFTRGCWEIYRRRRYLRMSFGLLFMGIRG